MKKDSEQPKSAGAVSSTRLLADVWKLEDEMGLRVNIRFHEILAAKARALGIITAQLSADQRMEAIEEWKSANIGLSNNGITAVGANS
jgi:hypothetical protein